MGKTMAKQRKKAAKQQQQQASAAAITKPQDAKNPSHLAADAAAPWGQKKVRFSALVSDALNASEWDKALKLLRGMRRARQAPKLGAVMRWVRAADSVGSETMAAALLAAIIRAADSPLDGEDAAVCAHADLSSVPKELMQAALDSGIMRFPAWVPTSAAGASSTGGAEPSVAPEVSDNTDGAANNISATSSPSEGSSASSPTTTAPRNTDYSKCVFPVPQPPPADKTVKEVSIWAAQPGTVVYGPDPDNIQKVWNRVR